jgi:hypothetical protein
MVAFDFKKESSSVTSQPLATKLLSYYYLKQVRSIPESLSIP